MKILGDTLTATLIGTAGLDLQAGLDRTRFSDPVNLIAESIAEVSTLQTLTFTVNVPSTFRMQGHLTAFGPSMAQAWLATDAGDSALFDASASQSVYNPTGFSTVQQIYAFGLLAPGTYTLGAQTFTGAMLQATALSLPGAHPRTRASSYFGLTLEITPVPLPAAGWMMLSGLALLVPQSRARGRQRCAAGST